MADHIDAGSYSEIPKPKLRGLHNAVIKRNLIIAGCLMTGVVLGLKFLRNEPKMKGYAEFYKNYDANASFDKMLEADLLQSQQQIKAREAEIEEEMKKKKR